MTKCLGILTTKLDDQNYIGGTLDPKQEMTQVVFKWFFKWRMTPSTSRDDESRGES